MTDQTTLDTAAIIGEKLIVAMQAQDLDTFASMFHPDIEVFEPAGLPYGGTYRGPEAFLGDLIPQIFGPYDLVISDSKVFDGGHAAAVHMQLSFTSRRTGATIDMPYIEIYTISNGLVTNIDVYPQDTATLGQWMTQN